jgi:transcriptional regulator with XRE-family HTH domain
MRTAADLAAAIPGGAVKESTIQNVEAGRKAELTVSQLLNIALALRLPPAYLLAPLGRPNGSLDLANLSDDFSSMTNVEFDGWLSGAPSGAFRITSASEHLDRLQLQALRELAVELRERTRLNKLLHLERELRPETENHESSTLTAGSQARLQETSRRITELTTYLESAGWDIAPWADSSA